MLPDYARWLFILIPAWLTGRFGFSFLWVMIGFAAFIVRKRDRLRHRRQDEMRSKAATCDVKSIVDVMRDPPSWIYFPKRERVDWLNKIVKQAWPFIDDYVAKYIKDNQQSYKEMIAQYGVENFEFKKCTVGDIAPRIVNICMRKSDEGPDGRVTDIAFDMELCYAGDAQIKVKLAYLATPTLTVGLKNVSFSGKMRVEMQNLTGRIPICGSLCCYFLNKPVMDFDLTNVGNMMDFSPLKRKIKSVIDGTVASMMVLPNRYPVPLMENIDTNLLRHPLPKGVLRVHVVNAKNLVSDNFFNQKDPYVKMQIGNVHKSTARITNEPNPVWNQVFEFVVWSSQQMLNIQLLDGDDLDFFDVTEDEALCDYDVGIKKVKDLGYLPQCIAVPALKEHNAIFNVRMLWSFFKTEPVDAAGFSYEDVYAQKSLLRPNSVGNNFRIDEDPILTQGSRSFVLVHLYGVEGLKTKPRTKNLRVILTLQGSNEQLTKQESTVQPASPEPKWEEAFQYLVQDFPEDLKLFVKIVDEADKEGEPLGRWSFNLNKIVAMKDWIWECQWHEEKGAAKSLGLRAPPRLSVRICLRILGVDESIFEVGDEEEEEEEEVEGKEAVEKVEDENEETEDKESRSVTPTQSFFAPRKKDQTHEASLDAATAKEAASDAAAPEDWKNLPHVKIEQIYGENIQGLNDERNEGFGLIRLTIEPKEGNVLRLVVHECKGLIAADDEGNTDAYVKLSMDRISGSEKTKIVEDSLNPSFEETFIFDLKRELLELQRLTVAVKNDKSFWSREPATVGIRVIDLGEYKLNQSVTRWFALKDASPGKDKD